jgi:Type II secretion system (T2SS), protein M
MRLTQRDRIMVLVLAAGIVLFAGWWFAIKPAGADAATARTELESVETQLAAARAQLAQTSSTRVSRASRTARTVRLSKATPPGPRIPEALVQLQRLAVRSSVTITTITGGDAVAGATSVGNPLTVELAGSFFAVDDFLYRLQNQVRVDRAGKLHVGGRLFSLQKADIAIDDQGARAGDVIATLNLLAVSSGAAPAADAAVATTTPATGTATP